MLKHILFAALAILTLWLIRGDYSLRALLTVAIAVVLVMTFEAIGAALTTKH